MPPALFGLAWSESNAAFHLFPPVSFIAAQLPGQSLPAPFHHQKSRCRKQLGNDDRFLAFSIGLRLQDVCKFHHCGVLHKAHLFSVGFEHSLRLRVFLGHSLGFGIEQSHHGAVLQVQFTIVDGAPQMKDPCASENILRQP